MHLLTETNPKVIKGEKKGYMTFILHLAPGTLSGYNVCPGASKGCLFSCLNTAGRGHMSPIQNARIRKTKLFFEDRDKFMDLLVQDIRKGIRKAERRNLIPVFRLNGTSDIRWETVRIMHPIDEPPMYEPYENIFEMFPDVQFYDYTKLSNRRNLPPNYHLTFSRSESNDDKVMEAISNGMNVAVVFSTKKGKDLPKWHQLGNVVLPVDDGDDTDLRFLGPKPCIVGLRAKGKASKDLSGFVVHV